MKYKLIIDKNADEEIIAIVHAHLLLHSRSKILSVVIPVRRALWDTAEEIRAMIEEIKKDPQQFRYVA